MKTQKILANEPRVLTQAQRQAYFDDGYIVVNDFIDNDWLEKLWAVTNRFIDESRTLSQSTDKLDIEADHTADNPRLRRLSNPVTHHELYWQFASQGPIVDLVEDLLGPDIVFHHSKLNFKWSGGGEEVKWHQDYPFYPHTAYSVLAVGLYMNDVDDEMGPMGAIPGSHRGPLYNHYNEQGTWSGALKDEEAAALDFSRVGWMAGKAGTVTVHNCCAVHGSRPNLSTRARPLLINAYSAADAIPLTSYPGSACLQNGTLIRGEPAQHIQFEADNCILPPDWSGGYTSIFDLQQSSDLEK